MVSLGGEGESSCVKTSGDVERFLKNQGLGSGVDFCCFLGNPKQKKLENEQRQTRPMNRWVRRKVLFQSPTIMFFFRVPYLFCGRSV